MNKLKKHKSFYNKIGYFLVFCFIFIFLFNSFANKIGFCIKENHFFDEKSTVINLLNQLIDVNHPLYNAYIHEYVSQKTFQDLNNTNNAKLPHINQKQLYKFVIQNPNCCQIYKGHELQKLYIEDILPPSIIDKLLGVEFAVLKFTYQNKRQESYIDDKHTQIILFSVNRCGHAQYRKSYMWFF